MNLTAARIWRGGVRLTLALIIGVSAGLATSAEDLSRIDRLLAKAHSQAKITTSPVCDDATFLRRLSLDLIGRVPTTDELQAFLDKPDREAAVDRLLDDEEHPRFWSHLWTSMLIGRSERQEVQSEVLRRWVEQRLADELGLNQIAFELMTAQGVTSLNGPVNYVVANRQDPVMSLSRTFLSVQLDCAQCHDHPHDRWTNDDYLAMKRFFRPVQYREVSGGVTVSDSGPNRDAEKPAFLTGRKPHTSAWRRELGLMVVQSKPFSRSMVNRTWHWLMGRGIVDPVDGLSRDNPASVPELLEELAADFREQDFQLRPLIRRICLSQAYQRSPSASTSTEVETQLALFAARNVRPQLPEQWVASVAVVLDRPTPEPAQVAERSRQLLGVTRQDTNASDPFAWTGTTQTLIRQLSGDMPPPLRNLESTFLATLARTPSLAERRRVKGQSSSTVLFALVHSNEFIMND